MVTFWRAAAEAETERDDASFDVPPPVVAEGPVSMHLEEPAPLRLHVCKLVGPQYAGRHRWVWRIVGPDRNTIALDAGRCPTQPEALAVGLAALDEAAARTAR